MLWCSKWILERLGLCFFIAAQIAQVAWPIWIALAGQLKQTLQQYRDTAWDHKYNLSVILCFIAFCMAHTCIYGNCTVNLLIKNKTCKVVNWVLDFNLKVEKNILSCMKLYRRFLHFFKTAHLVARWAAEWRVEQSILLWGNVSSQIHLISPGCPRPNSALTVHKSGLKHRSSIHPFLRHFKFIDLGTFDVWCSHLILH